MHGGPPFDDMGGPDDASESPRSYQGFYPNIYRISMKLWLGAGHRPRGGATRKMRAGRTVGAVSSAGWRSPGAGRVRGNTRRPKRKPGDGNPWVSRWMVGFALVALLALRAA